MKFDRALTVVLGMLIAGAGLGKLLDIAGFVAVIHTYQFRLPSGLAWTIAIGIIAFELTLGTWLISGRRARTALMLSVAMHVGYFILMIVTLARGIHLTNCGCFGVFLARPLSWHSPLWDLFYAGMSYYLFTRTNQKIAHETV